jgi:hypothetical protein
MCSGGLEKENWVPPLQTISLRRKSSEDWKSISRKFQSLLKPDI